MCSSIPPPTAAEIQRKLAEKNRQAAQQLLLRIKSQLANDVVSVKINPNGTTKNR